MILSDFLISYGIVQSLSGKFKTNFQDTKTNIVKRFLVLFFIFILLFLFILALIFEILLPLLNANSKIDIEVFFILIIGILSTIYILSITPILQNKKNYKFELGSSLKILYKNKEIKFNYVVGEDGKIEFADKKNKNQCVSYQDGSKMSKRLQYQISNYISWILIRFGIMEEQRVYFN